MNLDLFHRDSYQVLKDVHQGTGFRIVLLHNLLPPMLITIKDIL